MIVGNAPYRYRLSHSTGHLLQQRVEHLRHQPLPGLGELGNDLDVLLPLGHGTELHDSLGGMPRQSIHWNSEHIGEYREHAGKRERQVRE